MAQKPIDESQTGCQEPCLITSDLVKIYHYQRGVDEDLGRI
jgi:hypothetical protein